MQRKISKIAVKMTAVLMAVVVCLPMVMSVMKQNVYAAPDCYVTFDYNNGTGKTVKIAWGINGVYHADEYPTVEASDYPTEMSVFEGWYLVDDSGNMTTTEITADYGMIGSLWEDRNKVKAKWSESAYEITIPATTSINATDKTGSVDFSGKLGKNKEMSIAVSSANGNKMVNGSYDVDYTMDKNSFSYDSDDAIKTFSDSINFEVTSEPAVAGSYKDTLTFTITAEAKAIEVTIDHNDGTGTTSTAKLAIGEAVLASLPAITRDGYKFLGWTYVDASGNEVEVTDGLIYDGTITGFKANWVNMSPVLQKGSDFNKNIANTTTAIEFTTEAIPSSVTDYTDVSEAQDGSIVAYTDGSTVKISPKEEGTIIYANTDCSGMFSNLSSLTSIKFDNFDTTKVTDMTNLFYNCTSLTTLDLSSFNTSKVTSTGLMFGQCKTLTTIYVSNDFTTSNVTNSTYMFVRCFKLVGGNGTKYSGSYTDATYARIDTASTPGYFTLKSSTNTTSLNDEAEDDASILNVASLAKTYSSADFALDGDSAIETANLDDEASEEAVAYYHLNDDEDLNGLLAMSVESISIDGVMMDENAEYDDTKFVIEQSEDGVLTITSIVGEGYPSVDDWKTLIYGSIFTDINEDITITVSAVGLDENADINGFTLVEEQTSPDLKEEQTSSDVEGEEALDQEEGASESAEGASVVSWQAETDQTSSELKTSYDVVASPEQTSSDLVDEVEATATPEAAGVTSASAE